MTSVVYGNGSNLGIGHNDVGSVDALTWTTPGSTVVSTVNRSRDQRIVNERITDTTTPNTTFDYSYSYDGVGRLVAATVPFHELTYSFAADNGCGPNMKAGLNTNRTSCTDSYNGAPAVTTNYCYDNADRLLSTNGATNLSFTYDTYGNAIKVGTDTLGYDSTLRHMSTTTAIGTSINYIRDVSDRIVGRTANANPAQATRYGFTSDGGSPDFILDSAANLRQRVLKLPGGALLTKNYNQTQQPAPTCPPWNPSCQTPSPTPATTNWSYPNVRGDILFTADGSAARTGSLRLYDPYGQNIDPHTDAIGDIPNPATAEGGMDFGWLGQHAIPIEHVASQQAVEMGARTYLPVLGRFLQVDPVSGGSANNYEYVNGDPVNSLDLTGERRKGGGGKGGGKGGRGGVGKALEDLFDSLTGGDDDEIDLPYDKVTFTDESWEHIKGRHRPGGGMVDKNSNIFDGNDFLVQDRIRQTIDEGQVRNNTRNGKPAPGYVYRLDFHEKVGHKEGDPKKTYTAVEVVVDEDGRTLTAYPTN